MTPRYYDEIEAWIDEVFKLKVPPPEEIGCPLDWRRFALKRAAYHWCKAQEKEPTIVSGPIAM